MNLKLLLAVVAPCAGWAQGTGSIQGHVTDQSGSPVPGTQVRVVNEVNRFSRAVETDNQGGFAIANIPFFNYQVIFEHPGFTSHSEPLAIRSSTPARLDVHLDLAQVRQSVSVVEWTHPR
jgi:hypothetical protein